MQRARAYSQWTQEGRSPLREEDHRGQGEQCSYRGNQLLLGGQWVGKRLGLAKFAARAIEHLEIKITQLLKELFQQQAFFIDYRLSLIEKVI